MKNVRFRAVPIWLLDSVATYPRVRVEVVLYAPPVDRQPLHDAERMHRIP